MATLIHKIHREDTSGLITIYNESDLKAWIFKCSDLITDIDLTNAEITIKDASDLSRVLTFEIEDLVEVSNSTIIHTYDPNDETMEKLQAVIADLTADIFTSCCSPSGGGVNIFNSNGVAVNCPEDVRTFDLNGKTMLFHNCLNFIINLFGSLGINFSGNGKTASWGMDDTSISMQHNDAAVGGSQFSGTDNSAIMVVTQIVEEASVEKGRVSIQHEYAQIGHKDELRLVTPNVHNSIGGEGQIFVRQNVEGKGEWESVKPQVFGWNSPQGGDTIPAGTTEYISANSGPAGSSVTQSLRQSLVSHDCTANRIKLQTRTNQHTSGSQVFTLQVNETDTSVVLTLPANAVAGFYEVTGFSLALTANQRVNWKVDNNATVGGAAISDIVLMGNLAA